MAEYNVSFLIKRIIGIKVNADTHEEAIELATKKLKQGIFNKNIEYIDGNDTMIGVDNLDGWNEIE
jgi:hypothetical protein